MGEQDRSTENGMTTNPVHLYRSLLRECTYLPDARARSYIKDYVISRFRRHVPRAEGPKCRPEIPLQKQLSLLAEGRKFQSSLRRANEGYVRPLEKVLRLAYGRVGRRRRELISKLMTPETRQEQTTEGQKATEKFTRGWKPPGVMEALMRSQARHQPYLDRVGTTLKLKPKLEVAETTIWGKPMPKSRVKNATKRWYARNAAIVLPPLPESEWMEVKQLATGLKKWSPVKPRRPLGYSSADSDIHESGQVLLEGPKPGKRFKPYVNGRPHKITARFMRRQMARVVLKHTPLTEMSESKQGIAVRWEEGRSSRHRVAAPNPVQARVLFD